MVERAFSSIEPGPCLPRTSPRTQPAKPGTTQRPMIADRFEVGIHSGDVKKVSAVFRARRRSGRTRARSAPAAPQADLPLCCASLTPPARTASPFRVTTGEQSDASSASNRLLSASRGRSAVARPRGSSSHACRLVETRACQRRRVGGRRPQQASRCADLPRRDRSAGDTPARGGSPRTRRARRVPRQFDRVDRRSARATPREAASAPSDRPRPGR